MALVTPPAYQQAGSYSARMDRQVTAGMLTPHLGAGALVARSGVKPAPSGVANAGMRVTQRATPDRWVTIGAGTCYIRASSVTGGTYIGHNDGTYDVQLDAAHATLPRKDLIVARVYDAVDDVGSENDFRIEPVAGIPASSPARPQTPAQSIALAEVTVAAGSSTVTDANIADLRLSVVALGGMLPVASAADLPVNPYAGMKVYRVDLRQEHVWDGTGWRVGFDSAYNFPYGTLNWGIYDVSPNQVVSTTTEGAGGSVVTAFNTSFTMPAGVPSTRRIMLFATMNMSISSGGKPFYNWWLDGSAWDGRAGRRISIPQIAFPHEWSHTGHYAPPPAGNHNIQFRTWNDGSGSVTMYSGEITVVLM